MPTRCGHRYRRGLRDTLDHHGRLATTPDGHGLEAFFAAVLRRRS